MDDEKKTRKLLNELIELMKANDLVELEVEDEGCRIRLRKAEGRIERPIVYSTGMAGQAAGAMEQMVPAAGAGHRENVFTIKSPMVGTFYRAASPDSDSFVEPNDAIEDETVICIIEAMKVYNEIKAECKGVIKDILVANGEPVEYGQPLFIIEPA